VLKQTERLASGDSLTSKNGRYELVMQKDGNLVLFRVEPKRVPLWSTATNVKNGDSCSLQPDGNLVVYNKDGRAIWASDTNGHFSTRLVVQNDGSLEPVIDLYPGDSSSWGDD
jgi:hypothetical protein